METGATLGAKPRELPRKADLLAMACLVDTVAAMLMCLEQPLTGTSL